MFAGNCRYFTHITIYMIHYQFLNRLTRCRSRKSSLLLLKRSQRQRRRNGSERQFVFRCGQTSQPPRCFVALLIKHFNSFKFMFFFREAASTINHQNHHFVTPIFNHSPTSQTFDVRVLFVSCGIECSIVYIAILLPGFDFVPIFFCQRKTNATIIYWPRLIGIESQCDTKPTATKTRTFNLCENVNCMCGLGCFCTINLSIVNYVKKP